MPDNAANRHIVLILKVECLIYSYLSCSLIRFPVRAQVYRFATVINTHALKYPAKDPEILSDGRIKVGGWLISVNLKSDGAPSFFIRSTQEKVNITYKGEATVINEDGYETVMRDTVPELEI